MASGVRRFLREIPEPSTNLNCSLGNLTSCRKYSVSARVPFSRVAGGP